MDLEVSRGNQSEQYCSSRQQAQNTMDVNVRYSTLLRRDSRLPLTERERLNNNQQQQQQTIDISRTTGVKRQRGGTRP